MNISTHSPKKFENQTNTLSNIEEQIIISDVLKFKSSQSLEDRAAQFERRMVEIEKHNFST